MDLNTQIHDICEQVYGKQPVKTQRLYSLSNFIFYIEFSENEKFVLKILNLEADNIFLFDEKENEKILKESEFFKSLVYRETPTWRIENFIEGNTLLVYHHRSQDYRKMYMKRINEFHRMGSKENFSDHFLNRLWDYKPKIFTKIQKNIKGHPREEEVLNVLAHFEKYYTSFFKQITTDEKLVFVHNDLLYGNWLFNNKSKKLQLIDFEYSGFGFFMTDIYNVMIEALYDYTDEPPRGYVRQEEHMPNAEQLKELIRYYLFFDKHGEEFFEQTDEIEHLKAIESDPRLQAISQEEIDRFFGNIDLYGSIDNMYWSLWSFYIFKKPDCAMDHVSYAFDRYDDFCKHANKLGLNEDK